MKPVLLFVPLFLFSLSASAVFGTENDENAKRNVQTITVYPKESLQKNPIEDGQALFPGSTENPLASGNEVSVDYIPGGNVIDPDSVYAGLTKTGASENNTLLFKNGYVSQFVLGGISLKGDAKKNSVVFRNGKAADAAIGKLCGGQTRNGDVIENFVTISGGQIVGDVYGGDADGDGNAKDNQVEISSGVFSGFVNGGGVSGVGIAKKNRVSISGGTVGMGVSAGFAHFLADSSTERIENINKNSGKNDKEKTNSVLENTVSVSGSADIDGNVSGGFVLDSDGSANKNIVEISGGTIRGNVYGGRAFSGEANENSLIISGGTINGRDNVIYAGYVHKPENGRATGNSVTISGSPRLETITLYGNNLSTWKTDENTLNFMGFQGTVCGLSHFQEINVDKNSRITIVGKGPFEIFNLNNEGRIVFENAKPMVHGKTTGKPIE